MTRSRSWLRTFLRLDALQHVEGISDASVQLQEDTVLAALSILDREPGVLLADEVGMGKTFQALGLLAATFDAARDSRRQPRVLVVTPGPSLNHQWRRAADTFHESGFYRGFPPGCFEEVDHITKLPESVKRHAVVFAPVNIFTSARGRAERGFLLELWFEHREIHGRTRNAIWKRINESGVRLTEGQTFLGRGTQEFGRLPASTFRRTTKGHAGLDDLYGDGDLDAFCNAWAVKKALDRARFQLIRKVLPVFDLLVVDEAHKLKNPWTVQAQAVTHVLGGRFQRAVFLTATPFQLGVHELGRVFEMFGNASDVRDGFYDDVKRLFTAIEDYQRTYGMFEDAWRFAEPHQVWAFSAWYARVAGVEVVPDAASLVPGLDEVDDPNVVTLARHAWSLRRLKEHAVEPGFRRWTLRSLKPGKRERRCDRATRIVPDTKALAPLLLYQRLMTERARSRVRGHVEAAETSIASSFAAARDGAMVTRDMPTREACGYQELVKELLVATEDSHPKIVHVLDQAMAAADQWEKSLIFCERNRTIDALHAAIEERWMRRLLFRWQRLLPGLNREQVFGSGSGDERVVGVFQRWAMRFTRGQDQLSIVLREAYPHTLLVAPDEPSLPEELWSHVPELLADANEVLRAQRASSTSAERLDYRLARRCVDVAVARWFERNRPATLDGYDGLARNLLSEAYPSCGIDLIADDDEREIMGAADATIAWTISEETLHMLLSRNRPSIWFPFREDLARWAPTERSSIVEAIRIFLTRRQVPFILDVLEHCGDANVSSSGFRDALETLWRNPEWPWRRRVTEFLDYLPRLGSSERTEVLGEALRGGEFAARGNRSARRQAIQDAFNTPFFPMVLVGNRTMQEGLNLHRQCRRVIHHDLRWNPADVEQRVGRVDRHGSLAERWLAKTGGKDGHILIDTPLLERTIDPSRYRRVKEREKWLDFLLGVPPELGKGNLDDPEVEPLPVELADALRVRLGPPCAT